MPRAGRAASRAWRGARSARCLRRRGGGAARLRPAEIAVEGRAGDTERFADLRDGALRIGEEGLGQAQLGRVAEGLRPGAAALAATGAGGSEAGVGAGADEVTLKLGQGAEEVEDELAAR